MRKENLYATLGLPQSASESEIKAAYRALALQYHPDKNTSASAEEKAVMSEKMAMVTKAYKQLTNQESLSSNEIQGFLTHTIKPLSAEFKIKHSNYVMEFEEKPLSPEPKINHPLKELSGNSDVFNDILKPQASSEERQFNFKSLTPSVAAILFKNFLHGKYRGLYYLQLKTHFRSELKRLDKKVSLAEYEFYQSIYNIITMTAEEIFRKNLFDDMCTIMQYIRTTALYENHQLINSLTPLLQDKIFRKLYADAIKQYWAKPLQQATAADYTALFTSTIDHKIEIDRSKHPMDYQELLYTSQQYFLQDVQETMSSEKLRKMAFDTLDFIQVINGSKNIVINSFLQAAFLFLQASFSEENSARCFADESLAISLSLSAISIARTNNALSDLYAHSHVMKIIKSLRNKHQHPNMDEIEKLLEKHALKLVDFFPCYEPLSSHLDLFLSSFRMITFMRTYLNGLVAALDKDEQVEHERVTVFYNAFEACLDGWYLEKNSEETERELRQKAMEELLFEKGWIFPDVSENISSDSNMASQDAEYWMQPGKSLPFSENFQTFESFDGIEYDLKNGKITFSMKTWAEKSPYYQKTFSQYDLFEMIRNNISASYFSLDQADFERHYHPFQQMTFRPGRLHQTEYLYTQLITDVLLKNFTTGYEAQNKYPYDLRPITNLIAHLPPHLKKIISDFHEGRTRAETHRFWIETSYIPTLIEENRTETEHTLRFTMGKLNMVIKKHKMTLDSDGKLIDQDEDKEGWTIYVLTEARENDLILHTQLYEQPAIFIIKNTENVYFCEHNKLSSATIVLSSDLQKELNVQMLDVQGKIIKASDDQEKNTMNNRHFLYQLTREITTQANKPHYFSNEFVFAEEFTENYDEFAQYFPEFGRLTQLARIACGVRELNRMHSSLEEEIPKMEVAYNSPEHWKKVEEETKRKLIPLLIQDYQRYPSILNETYTQVLNSQTTHLQEMRYRIGSFVYTASSPEVINFCNEQFEKVKAHFVTTKGQAFFDLHQAQIRLKNITEEMTNIVAQFNQAGQNKRQQVFNLYHSDLAPTLGEAAYNQLIEAFVNNNVNPLAQALANKRRVEVRGEMKIVTKQKFSNALDNDIDAAMDGNPAPLATAHATTIAPSLTSAKKAEYLTEINSKKTLRSHFTAWDFQSNSTEVEIDKACLWIPSCYAHTGNALVYGGVVIAPSMALKEKVNQHKWNLSFPTVSAFNNADNIRYNIDNAKKLLQDTEDSLRGLPICVDATPVKNVLDDLRSKIKSAEFSATTSSFLSNVSTAINFIPIPGLSTVRYAVTGLRVLNRIRIADDIADFVNGNSFFSPRILRARRNLESLDAPSDELILTQREANQLSRGTPQDTAKYLRHYFEKNRPLPGMQEIAELQLEDPFPLGSVAAGKNWTVAERIEKAGLPSSGQMPFRVDKRYNPAMNLDRFERGGFIDADGNIWEKGPSRTPDEHHEWDVQLSPSGVEFCKRNNIVTHNTGRGPYANISMKGMNTH